MATRYRCEAYALISQNYLKDLLAGLTQLHLDKINSKNAERKGTALPPRLQSTYKALQTEMKRPRKFWVDNTQSTVNEIMKTYTGLLSITNEHLIFDLDTDSFKLSQTGIESAQDTLKTLTKQLANLNQVANTSHYRLWTLVTGTVIILLTGAIFTVYGFVLGTSIVTTFFIAPTGVTLLCATLIGLVLGLVIGAIVNYKGANRLLVDSVSAGAYAFTQEVTASMQEIQHTFNIPSMPENNETPHDNSESQKKLS